MWSKPLDRIRFNLRTLQYKIYTNTDVWLQSRQIKCRSLTNVQEPIRGHFYVTNATKRHFSTNESTFFKSYNQSFRRIYLGKLPGRKNSIASPKTERKARVCCLSQKEYEDLLHMSHRECTQTFFITVGLFIDHHNSYGWSRPGPV